MAVHFPPPAKRRPAENLQNRVAELGELSMRFCTVPGCTRSPLAAAGKGLSMFLCRYHVQRQARHGSSWHGSYSAGELRPYVKEAMALLKANTSLPSVGSAIGELNRTMANAGRVEPAMDIRHRDAAFRARVAFARLREAGVSGRRLLALYLGTVALIEDDWGSHRTREFIIVQAAKAAHRLASGTHKTYEHWKREDDSFVPWALHVYPRSSGRVLRKIGDVLARAGEPLVGGTVPAIIAQRERRFGPHPSHLPV